MRIALVDSGHAGVWLERPHRFAHFAAAFRDLGHEVHLIDASDRTEAVPYVAGLGRESDIAGLIAAARLPARIRQIAPDLCICPLRGGVAHGVLMARACGEIDAGLAVLLLSDGPSRSLLIRGDVGDESLRICVDDALERACLAHADLLLEPVVAAPLDDLGLPSPAALPDALALPASAALSPNVLASRGRDPVHIAFVGRFDRASGIVAFIDAAERLAAAGLMDRRTLVFAGPIEDGHLTVGKQWLGRRASRWSFPFKIVETSHLDVALHEVMARDFVAFLPTMPRPALSVFERANVELLDDGCRDDGIRLHVAIEAHLADRSTVRQAGTGGIGLHLDGAEIDAAARTVLTAVAGRAPRPAPRAKKASLSFCIVHFDRPAMLRDAVDSILSQVAPGDAIEVVIIDNGSRRPESLATLERLAERPAVRVLRPEQAMPIPAALNRVAADARHDFLVFLDDDNVMAEGGVQALMRACAGGAFDVVVSNLEVFENDRAEPGPTVATVLFIGPAATSGLFFNGFGDTSMAARRDAFFALGGFVEGAGPYPAADWIILAKAQAADLRIGVLQRPAFRYRRDVAKQDLHWQKYDQHGVRQNLLRVYGAKFDPLIVARLAQTVLVDDQ